MKAAVTLEAEQEVTLEWRGEMQTFTVCFTVEASAWHQPARISGPPEDCYPEEGEVDIESTKIDAVLDGEDEPVEEDAELATLLLSALNTDRIQELVWEAAWDEWNGRGG